MKTIKSIGTALAISTTLAVTSFSSSAAMDPYIETALIDVCKAAKSNSVIKYVQTSKSYRLKDKTIALKVMCNGNDIITFAEMHNAYKTAGRLEKSIGGVSITDVASVEKINVNFVEE